MALPAIIQDVNDLKNNMSNLQTSVDLKSSIKNTTKSNIGILSNKEIGVASDTNEVSIGNNGTNLSIATVKDSKLSVNNFNDDRSAILGSENNSIYISNSKSNKKLSLNDNGSLYYDNIGVVTENGLSINANNGSCKDVSGQDVHTFAKICGFYVGEACINAPEPTGRFCYFVFNDNTYKKIIAYSLSSSKQYTKELDGANGWKSWTLSGGVKMTITDPSMWDTVQEKTVEISGGMKIFSTWLSVQEWQAREFNFPPGFFKEFVCFPSIAQGSLNGEYANMKTDGNISINRLSLTGITLANTSAKYAIVLLTIMGK